MTDIRVAIIGSGFGGLGAAIRLKNDGIDDFVVLERAGDVGGTWRDNTYPGCACDVESHLYTAVIRAGRVDLALLRHRRSGGTCSVALETSA